MTTPGKLYLVATPIGNLEDITFRGIKTLQQVETILCEDTRMTSKVLNKFEFKTPLLSYHEHSNLKKQEKIIDLLKQGKELALVSDAGTPGVSDPGNKLISQILEQAPDTSIEVIPGPSALTASISISGLNLNKFLFLGFLPHKKGRQKLLKEIKATSYPVIIYESKYRLLKLLRELSDYHLEENYVIIAKELTKIHEQVYRGKIKDLKTQLEENSHKLKGEFVVIINK